MTDSAYSTPATPIGLVLSNVAAFQYLQYITPDPYVGLACTLGTIYVLYSTFFPTETED